MVLEGKGRAHPATPLLMAMGGWRASLLLLLLFYPSCCCCHTCRCGTDASESVRPVQGDLMCCETCSTTMHAPCAGLETVPEGDWYCPWCHCGACGQPGHWGEQAEGAQAPPLLTCGVAWVECGEGYRSVAMRAAGADGEQPLRPPYVGPPEEEGEQAGASAAAAHAADGAADGAVHMEIDGTALGSAAAGAAEQLGAVEGSSSGPAAAQQGLAAGARPGSGRLNLSQLLAVLAEAAAPAPPAAALLGGAAAGEAAAAQSEAAGTSAGEAVEARCPVTGQRHHARCLPPGFFQGQEQQQQGEREGDDGSGSSQPPLWFSSRGAELLSWRLAQLCSRGLVPVGTLGDGTPVSFQLVRGAAVAQPQVNCMAAKISSSKIAGSVAGSVAGSCRQSGIADPMLYLPWAALPGVAWS